MILFDAPNLQVDNDGPESSDNQAGKTILTKVPPVCQKLGLNREEYHQEYNPNALFHVPIEPWIRITTMVTMDMADDCQRIISAQWILPNPFPSYPNV